MVSFMSVPLIALAGAGALLAVAVGTPWLRPVLQPGRQGFYGLDAPYEVLKYGGGGLLSSVLGVWSLSGICRKPSLSCVLRALVGLLLLGLAVLPCFIGGTLLYGSLRGKFDVADRLLGAEIGPLTGSERVLDVGCGSGLLALSVAKQLKAAAGHKSVPPVACIDLWATKDQSGNSVERLYSNAAAEGLSRSALEVVTGDVRSMPPEWSGRFDVVVSMTVLHNIFESDFSAEAKAERAKAIKEAVRVLKPGGRLTIFDICPGPPEYNEGNGCAVLEYVKMLEGLKEMREVSVSEPLPVFSPSYIVKGTKRQ